MRNADIKFKVESLVTLLDDWLQSIDNETNPEDDFKTDSTINSYPEMQYPYQAGVWKARAGINAQKLFRIRMWLLNEFREVGLQSRK